MEIQRYEHLFDPEDESGKILLNWWRNLENDRGGRAEIRRAKNPMEVIFCAAYHRLFSALHLFDKEALACVAGVTSHVITHRSNESLALQMGVGEKPRVSRLRFRRFLAINDRRELYYGAVRIVRLLDNRVNICDLAQTVYWWNDRTKKKLAYEYYANAIME